jgi:mutator protein MutT
VTPLVVCAAVIERDGRFLITRRQQGVHLAGFWEFPGGKCDAGETLAGCLARELREELAVEAVVGQEIFSTTHAYPDRSVELHFLHCEIVGEPSPQVGQDMQWAGRTELKQLSFPPADIELVRCLTRADGA